MKCIKTANPGNLQGLSGFETPFSYCGRMSNTKVEYNIVPKHDNCHVLNLNNSKLSLKNIDNYYKVSKYQTEKQMFYCCAK
ncbi:MAG: hypothetical protein PHE33_06485 [Bacteroidales bacterium]|nr:hypothetical protein [Bacteroidales bacterium]